MVWGLGFGVLGIFGIICGLHGNSSGDYAAFYICPMDPNTIWAAVKELE